MKITRRKHSLYRFILQQLPDHWTTDGWHSRFHHKISANWKNMWNDKGKLIMDVTRNNRIYVYDESELPTIKRLISEYEDYRNRGINTGISTGKKEIGFEKLFEVTIVLVEPEEI